MALPTLQTVFVMVGIAGGLVAAFRAIFEMGASTEQRREELKQRKAELRWRQASTAREVLHEIHCHPLASSAVRMLDWSEGEHSYKTESGETVMISYEAVCTALRKRPSEASEGAEAYIRDCFDWFFYFVDRIEHYIQIDLITDADVLPVFAPYAEKVSEHTPMYDAFLESHRYALAKRFLKRYERPARRRSG